MQGDVLVFKLEFHDRGDTFTMWRNGAYVGALAGVSAAAADADPQAAKVDTFMLPRCSQNSGGEWGFSPAVSLGVIAGAGAAPTMANAVQPLLFGATPSSSAAVHPARSRGT